MVSDSLCSFTLRINQLLTVKSRDCVSDSSDLASNIWTRLTCWSNDEAKKYFITLVQLTPDNAIYNLFSLDFLFTSVGW